MIKKRIDKFPMKKRIAVILSLIIASQFTVFARKTHKPNRNIHTSHIKTHSHNKHKTHKVKDLRPELTIDDVKNQENLWGIDVSHYQSNINWVDLENEKPNFMFIKASEGTSFKDEKYSTYYTEAKKLGIPVGSYHFFTYNSTGKDQANNFLSTAQHTNGDLLPVLDAEYTRSMPNDKEKIKAELIDYVITIYDKLGFYPIIYCNYRYFQTYLAETILQNCKLWIVDYKDKPECNWTLWQSTNKFKLTSIKGHVDLNFINGGITNLKDLIYETKTGQLF